MIAHNRPTLGKAEQLAAERTLSSGWVAQGREVAAFEDEICEFLNLPKGHAVAVSSGTAALFLALWLLKAKGQRVALPVYSCVALLNAVRFAGAEPYFLDCESGTPNPVAPAADNADIFINPWHYGLPSLTRAPANCKMIEDGAHALGAKLDGAPLGHHGEVAILSFYATKLLTSGGQGGMVVSRDKSLIDAARDFREFDEKADGVARFNIQMTDLQAAIGREQLKQLPKFITRRSEIFNRYQELPVDWLKETSERQEPIRYRAIFRSDEPEKVIRHLKSRGVTAIQPLETRELLAKDTVLYPVASKLAGGAVSLPIYPTLTDEQCEAVCRAVQECAIAVVPDGATRSK